MSASGQANLNLDSSLRRVLRDPSLVEIEIRRPDDWHLHLRDGAAMAAVLPFTAARFGRAIVMPNLKPPVTTAGAAIEYRERILAALPAGSNFSPLMSFTRPARPHTPILVSPTYDASTTCSRA